MTFRVFAFQNKRLGREPFRYTRTELASELLEVCYEPYDSNGDSRCAVASTPADRAGPSGSAKIGSGPLSGVVHCGGSTTIRSSARDADTGKWTAPNFCAS